MKRLMILVMAAICISLCAGVAYAAPSVKITDRKDNVTVQERVTAEILAEIKKGVDATKDLTFTVEKVRSVESFANLCEAFPNMKSLSIIAEDELTSIAPVAKLKNMTRFLLRGGTVTDFSPLSELTGLTSLQLEGTSNKNGMMAPDLKWMSKLTNLTYLTIGAPSGLGTLVSFEGIPAALKVTSVSIKGAAPADMTPLQALSGLKKIDLMGSTIADLTPLVKLPELDEVNLYGATVKDFSPLAACAKLQKVNYYATKDSDYSTLGALTQVRELQGGLTKLADISWVANLPNLKKFNVFSEKVTDYTPLGKVKVEDFTIWKMDKPVDVKQLADATSLTRLKLWNLDETTGFEGLGALVNLKELIIDGVNSKKGTVDLASTKSLANVETLELTESNFVNTKGLEGLGKLKKATVSKANKVGDTPFDLAFLAKTPELETLSITDSKISNLDAVAKCEKLKSVTLVKIDGLTSLAAIKKLPNLQSVTVSKDAFPEAELSGFGGKVKVNQR